MKCYYDGGEQDLHPYVGMMRQVAGVQTSVLDDGKGRGMRVANVDNGSGLSFTVLPDRGMDIGAASFKGIGLCYITPVGYADPAFCECEGLRWLRAFGGGLMTGCGLSNVGVPELEEGMPVAGPLGLHGRISSIPAEQVAVSSAWRDGRYVLTVAGTVRETGFFSENLELHRVIETALGENTITLRDRIVNRGARPAPFMQLYHINLGYPLLTENATVSGTISGTVPRNALAAENILEWPRCQPPTPDSIEQCYYHNIEADDTGMATLTLNSPDAGLALDVSFRKEELPCFTQWKMMGVQEYVMGFEPANCHPDGQRIARESGTLKTLSPGQAVEHLVRIGVRTR